MSSSYENHVYLAKLAEQAERYEGTFRPPQVGAARHADRH